MLLLEAGDAIGGPQLRSPYRNRWLPGVVNQTGRDVAASLQQHLADASVPYRLGFRIDRLCRPQPQGEFELWHGRDVVRAVHVVLATGARPRTGGFAESDSVAIGPGMPMERLPVTVRQGHVVVDQQGAVAGIPRLYAAGEVTGYWHPCVATSYAQGIQVAKSIQLRLHAEKAHRHPHAIVELAALAVPA